MKVPLLLFSSIHHTSDYQCTLGKCTIPSFYSYKEGDFMRFHVILLSSFSLCKIVEKMLPSFSLFEKMLKYFFRGWAGRSGGPVEGGSNSGRQWPVTSSGRQWPVTSFFRDLVFKLLLGNGPFLHITLVKKGNCCY